MTGSSFCHREPGFFREHRHAQPRHRLSVFSGKAGVTRRERQCQLMALSGHQI
jgi:hypothetical protein